MASNNPDPSWCERLEFFAERIADAGYSTPAEGGWIGALFSLALALLLALPFRLLAWCCRRWR